MNYKLKHLSKFCCKPANELEFEAVKMAAELGGVDWYEENEFEDNIDYPFLILDEADDLIFYMNADGKQLISTLYFCKKLRMSEEEARELEDDRVDISLNSSAGCDFMRGGVKRIVADDGYKWRLSDDCKEVYLVKE